MNVFTCTSTLHFLPGNLVNRGHEKLRRVSAIRVMRFTIRICVSTSTTCLATQDILNDLRRSSLAHHLVDDADAGRENQKEIQQVLLLCNARLIMCGLLPRYNKQNKTMTTKTQNQKISKFVLIFLAALFSVLLSYLRLVLCLFAYFQFLPCLLCLYLACLPQDEHDRHQSNQIRQAPRGIGTI